MTLVRILPVFAALAILASGAAAAPAPESELVDCSRAANRITVRTSSHLDPSCTWTRGVRILASDLVFDCQGALIAATDRQYGLEISAPTTMALSNITVRNCRIDGFLDSVRITREGFRDLAEGVEYDNAFSNIVIENVTYGIRVEDDDNTITGNHFSGDGTQQAIVVGTSHRTATLGRPVRGTTVTGNTAMIPFNAEPYRWINL